MMKISDPIIFGHCVKVFFKDAFEKHGAVLEQLGANPNDGLGSVLAAVEKKLPEDQAAAIVADFDACYEERPWLAMVNSDKGITNLVRALTTLVCVCEPKIDSCVGQLRSTFRPMSLSTHPCPSSFVILERCGTSLVSSRIPNA